MNVQKPISMGLFSAKRTVNVEYHIRLPVIAKAFEDELRARIGGSPTALSWQVAEHAEVTVESGSAGTDIHITYPHGCGVDIEIVDRELGVLILCLEADVKEAGRNKRLMNILA